MKWCEAVCECCGNTLWKSVDKKMWFYTTHTSNITIKNRLMKRNASMNLSRIGLNRTLENRSPVTPDTFFNPILSIYNKKYFKPEWTKHLTTPSKLYRPKMVWFKQFHCINWLCECVISHSFLTPRNKISIYFHRLLGRY